MVSQTSLNPIIPGFSPDPSAVYIDGWFFLVTSSFHLFPGLPIYASQDLTSWKHIGNAINRQSQLSLLKSRTTICDPAPESDGLVLLATGGLYAPTLRYHDGTFYIVCTNASRNQGDMKSKKDNFIISTKDIWKCEWSDPIYFQFEGIDPSLTFDGDRVYIQGSATPGPATRINNFEIDLKTGQRLSDERTIWTGMGGVYPEGPHVFKLDHWYYLIISEGGTHITHSVTAARSRSIWGPYTPAPKNPVLTAYGTDEYVQHTGHCDVFQDGDGKWWAVCLATRKNQGMFVLSRETFLTPAWWQDGWLYMETVKTTVKDHDGKELPSFALSTAPMVDYVYVRDAQLDRYHLEQGGEVVTQTPSSVDLSSPDVSPTFLAKRQRVFEGKATATVSQFVDAWSAAKMKFGLACYKDEHRFFRIYFDVEDTSVVFELVNVAQDLRRTTRQPVKDVAEMTFNFYYTEMEYTVKYLAGAGASELVLATVGASEMTDPDFTGPLIGVFSITDTDGAQVKFENFHVE